MLNKELIIQKCRENGACISEFTILVNSKTDKEFGEVLLDNLSWLKSENLIQYIDTRELIKYIGNNNKWIYNYCINVEDIKELWTKLTEDYWIYYYCRFVEDRPELWSRLTEPEYIIRYCEYVEDRPELRIKLKKTRLKGLKC